MQRPRSYPFFDVSQKGNSDMGTKSIIADLLEIPTRFYESSCNESLYSLLKATGYFETYNDISVTDIQNFIIHRPELINEWKRLSENKRTHQGWFFKQVGSSEFVVGRLGADRLIKQAIHFEDIVQAASLYIKNEIEEIRETSTKV